MSIKDAEHQKRNSMFLEGSRNIFPSSNLAVPLARNFNSFFGNAKNKIRLQDFQFIFSSSENLCIYVAGKMLFN